MVIYFQTALRKRRATCPFLFDSLLTSALVADSPFQLGTRWFSVPRAKSRGTLTIAGPAKPRSTAAMMGAARSVVGATAPIVGLARPRISAQNPSASKSTFTRCATTMPKRSPSTATSTGWKTTITAGKASRCPIRAQLQFMKTGAGRFLFVLTLTKLNYHLYVIICLLIQIYRIS